MRCFYCLSGGGGWLEGDVFSFGGNKTAVFSRKQGDGTFVTDLEVEHFSVSFDPVCIWVFGYIRVNVGKKSLREYKGVRVVWRKDQIPKEER